MCAENKKVVGSPPGTDDGAERWKVGRVTLRTDRGKGGGLHRKRDGGGPGEREERRCASKVTKIYGGGGQAPFRSASGAARAVRRWRRRFPPGTGRRRSRA